MSNYLHGFKSTTRQEFYKSLKRILLPIRTNMFKRGSTDYITYEIHSEYEHHLNGAIIAEEITPLMSETQYYLSTIIYK